MIRLRVGIPSETRPGERRVALSPEGVASLVAVGFQVAVQADAGHRAFYTDEEYRHAGAEIVPEPGAVCGEADIVLRVLGPSDTDSPTEVCRFKPGTTLVSFLAPVSNPRTVKALADGEVTAFSMDLVPRITRAQRMDALSAMSTIAGYKAALLAASRLPKFYPLLMTAAGTIPPARVLIIGAGVAGLQAIATCRRLGAVVEAFDVRPAVKEQVESLGAKFVAMDIVTDDAQDASGYAKEVSGDTHSKELDLIGNRMAKNDVVITTALIPGRPAPKLITRDMVRRMPPGSVIVDLAAMNGGNCEATVPGQEVVVDDVLIAGPLDLLSDMAHDASRMYSKNIVEFLLNLAPEGNMKLDLEDPILRDTLVTHQGKVVHEPTRLALQREGQS
ncbi:MAG: Re/Si-specific NAD(P)(+) transhydrogenase subunit alpha [Fimbriimonadaceae bacterium]|nr:Re/Si-specific NAD(P)(+) transhydrogenase subunit alpha [Fimbriimonadaceae bacterium]